MPGVVVTSWYGLLARKGTPAPVVAQLAAEVSRIFGAPPVQAQLEHEGLNVWIVTAGAFGEVIRKETATWAPVVKSRKIEAQ